MLALSLLLFLRHPPSPVNNNNGNNNNTTPALTVNNISEILSFLASSTAQAQAIKAMTNTQEVFDTSALK
jgi:hypothetical protein